MSWIIAIAVVAIIFLIGWAAIRRHPETVIDAEITAQAAVEIVDDLMTIVETNDGNFDW